MTYLSKRSTTLHVTCASLLALLLWTVPPAFADSSAADTAAAGPAAWSLSQDQGTVLLLGSIHVLPEHMAELPAQVRKLYAQADTLVMELAMDQLDPLAFQAHVNALGRQPGGSSLADTLGDAQWTQAQGLAEQIDLQLDMLSGVKPWLAALTVTQLRLMQMGFSPEYGLEVQMTGWATRDGKP
ncbi:MAG: TraB/GumN family protein, partial [Gammaproteobacteria bacterium]|nr:TraB/GumN family protein [Gammaproteobacteria bacterium]